MTVATREYCPEENVRMDWHADSIEKVLEHFDSSLDGLGTEDARSRLEKYGYNKLVSEDQSNAWRLLLSQFKNVLIIILLAATALSGLLGHGIEAVAISVIVLFAVLLGFLQEFRAEKALRALSELAAPAAKVFRGGKEVEVPASEIVPGDVCLLCAGDKVPADARLLHSVNLQVEEASLTGESVPAEKSESFVAPEDASLGDRRNMVFSGTAVSYGRGKALVTATGMETELGKIAGMLQDIGREKTPLQKNLDKVGTTLARAAVVIVFLIVALGIIRGQPLLEIFMFGIALAVAVVPEALPAVVTISLALGVQRMARRHALMRRLPAVETLGSTTVICSDKTGTLTKDEMTVKQVMVSGTRLNVGGTGYVPEGDITPASPGESVPAALGELIHAGVLCNDARLTQDENGAWRIGGDPTEGALLTLARKAGVNIEERRARFQRIDEQPFSSEMKRMVTLHENDASKVAYIKGAPEAVIPHCAYTKTDDGAVPLDDAGRAKLLDEAHRMAEGALRVLALATNTVSDVAEAERAAVFLGMVGMIDPPRKEAGEAVEECKEAGILPVMITGDHPVTARAIARELGILTDGIVVTGTQLQAMSDEELQGSLDSIQVFARVAPEHKLRIVKALQNKKHVVAMTGDGVNDAPALKKADIGVSMGITGTQVARDAGAMVITDDNFASIVSAIEEGRGIYENIRKYVAFMLSLNIGELILLALAAMLGMALPLETLQILYVNFAVEGLPAMALAVDPVSRRLMKNKPRDPGQGIFSKALLNIIIVGAIWSALVNFMLYKWQLSIGAPLARAQAVTFISLILIQFFKVYSFRSKDTNILAENPFKNKWLNLAIVVEVVLLIILLYVPFLQNVFGTFGFSFTEWSYILITAVTIVPVLEVAKWINRRFLPEQV
ncbi:MAG: HAD-IC family P-type ATPase [Chitinivibrionales bacterium]|nr:HAD-IC family P-type ATPase [Chitinivibrionales bacterium]MBD3357923.1 HAD-IC family P-type ATPase [Chitinivibrionales bacterium]